MIWARVELLGWAALVHTALFVLRPVAVVVDVLAPRLRCLTPSTGHSNRRTP